MSIEAMTWAMNAKRTGPMKMKGDRRWSVDDLDVLSRALGLAPASLLKGAHTAPARVTHWYHVPLTLAA